MLFTNDIQNHYHDIQIENGGLFDASFFFLHLL